MNDHEYYPFEWVKGRINEVWGGNDLEPGELISDGHWLIRADAIKKKADEQRLRLRRGTGSPE